MSLVHDDDLARIHETWDNVVTKLTLTVRFSHKYLWQQGLGSLHPDAIMLHLEISKPEIVQHVVDCEYMAVSPLFPFSQLWYSQ